MSVRPNPTEINDNVIVSVYEFGESETEKWSMLGSNKIEIPTNSRGLEANSVQFLLSSDKMETPSDVNSSDLLSHDESRNRMGTFGMSSSLLSGFSSVLTAPQYKKGGELEA